MINADTNAESPMIDLLHDELAKGSLAPADADSVRAAVKTQLAPSSQGGASLRLVDPAPSAAPAAANPALAEVVAQAYVGVLNKMFPANAQALLTVFQALPKLVPITDVKQPPALIQNIASDIIATVPTPGTLQSTVVNGILATLGQLGITIVPVIPGDDSPPYQPPPGLVPINIPIPLPVAIYVPDAPTPTITSTPTATPVASPMPTSLPTPFPTPPPTGGSIPTGQPVVIVPPGQQPPAGASQCNSYSQLLQSVAFDCVSQVAGNLVGNLSAFKNLPGPIQDQITSYIAQQIKAGVGINNIQPPPGMFQEPPSVIGAIFSAIPGLSWASALVTCGLNLPAAALASGIQYLYCWDYGGSTSHGVLNSGAPPVSSFPPGNAICVTNGGGDPSCKGGVSGQGCNGGSGTCGLGVFGCTCVSN